MGFITKGRGLSIHRADCSNIQSLSEEEKQRFIEVEWDTEKEFRSFETDITLLAEDRKGLFSNISKICEDMDVHITGVMGKSNSDNTAHITITVQISNVNQIAQLIRRLKQIEGMIEVHRGNS